MKEHGICAKCKKSVSCSYADDRITGCKKFVLEPELELNNEEWLRSATTEQLAEWLGDAFDLCGAGCSNCFVKELCFDEHNNKMPTDLFKMWLKQPHTKE